MHQLIERGFFKFPPIMLSQTAGPASVNPPVQVLRVGKFSHPQYGEFEITRQTLAEMKANFDANVRGVDVAFDYFHESDKEASGWPSALYLKEDGDSLWATVDWTPTASKKLAERELRYFSPDFAFQWKDPESGAVFKNVLFGGGLTNRPFVKDMAAIVASEQKGKPMTEEQMKKLDAVLKLAEDSAKSVADMHKEQLAMKSHIDALKAPAPKAAPVKAADAPADSEDDEDSEDPAVLKKQLSAAKKQLAEYAEKAKGAEQAKQMAEKEAAFTVMLTEGKACVAQKEAFLKSDMTEFVKLAQPVNLNGQGSSATGSKEAGDREDQILKLAEAKCKADAKLPLHLAIKLANAEIK